MKVRKRLLLLICRVLCREFVRESLRIEIRLVSPYLSAIEFWVSLDVDRTLGWRYI